jgi:hypothetical protein
VESEGRGHASRVVFRIARGSKQLVGFDRQLDPPYLVVFCELIGGNYDGRWPDRSMPFFFIRPRLEDLARTDDGLNRQPKLRSVTVNCGILLLSILARSPRTRTRSESCLAAGLRQNISYRLLLRTSSP